MFVYEVAAELKAQTERVVVIYSKATIKTVVHALSTTYNYITSFSSSKSRTSSRKVRRSSKRKRIPPPSPSFASTVYDDDMDNLDLDSPVAPTDVNQLMEQMRLLQEQMAAFSKLQAAVAQANASGANISIGVPASTSNVSSALPAKGCTYFSLI